MANVQVQLVDSICAMVPWDDFPNYARIVVQYGPINVSSEQWTSIEITDSTFRRICDFPWTGYYGLRVKAECEKRET
ncbi:MAG: hypothetical protein IJ634_05615 [Bacteroidales bacterium]|nr:hypothetical protein [Bacteroidales bacterium]